MGHQLRRSKRTGSAIASIVADGEMLNITTVRNDRLTITYLCSANILSDTKLPRVREPRRRATKPARAGRSPDGHRVVAAPILAGLHHEYRREPKTA